MSARTIDSLGMEELVNTYLCSKYGKDPVKCIDCASLSGCPAGKRAVDILDEMTGGEKSLSAEQRNAVRRIKVRLIAEEASRSGDPIGYLVKRYGMPRNKARARLVYYRKIFPDLDLSAKEVDYSHAHEDDKIEAMANYKAALQSGNPVQWYMKNLNLSAGTARQRLWYARKKYSVSDDAPEEATKESAEEEISLADFISQHDGAVSIPEESECEQNVAADSESDGKIYIDDPKLESVYKKLLLKQDKLYEEYRRYSEVITYFQIVMETMAYGDLRPIEDLIEEACK